MGGKARATTDEHGKQLLGDMQGLRTVPLVQERKNPYEIVVEDKEFKTLKLGELLTHRRGAFHMLASHLLNECGYHARQECEAAKVGTLRVVRVGLREYRADPLRIFDRKARQWDTER